MARRFYRRRTVVVRPKKRWASNFASANLSLSTTSSQAKAATGQVLVQNSTQSSSPTPTIVKAGNFKVQGDCYIVPPQGSASLVQAVLYVMYVPQGFTLTTAADYENLVQSHPEWIMTWKMLDMNGTTTQLSSFTFSSRLKRNLNSGDSIQLVAMTEASVGIQFGILTKVQYWTTTA